MGLFDYMDESSELFSEEMKNASDFYDKKIKENNDKKDNERASYDNAKRRNYALATAHPDKRDDEKLKKAREAGQKYEMKEYKFQNKRNYERDGIDKDIYDHEEKTDKAYSKADKENAKHKIYSRGLKSGKYTESTLFEIQ